MSEDDGSEKWVWELEDESENVIASGFASSEGEAEHLAATAMRKPRKQAGILVGHNGKAVCPGVVCKCPDRCPMHG